MILPQAYDVIQEILDPEDGEQVVPDVDLEEAVDGLPEAQLEIFQWMFTSEGQGSMVKFQDLGILWKQKKLLLEEKQDRDFNLRGWGLWISPSSLSGNTVNYSHIKKKSSNSIRVVARLR